VAQVCLPHARYAPEDGVADAPRLDLVSADDGTAHTLDLAYHPAGTWATAPPGVSTTPLAQPGYTYLF
jgi:hypothetical protein